MPTQRVRLASTVEFQGWNHSVGRDQKCLQVLADLRTPGVNWTETPLICLGPTPPVAMARHPL